MSVCIGVVRVNVQRKKWKSNTLSEEDETFQQCDAKHEDANVNANEHGHGNGKGSEKEQG